MFCDVHDSKYVLYYIFVAQLRDPYILCENRESPRIECPTATSIKIKDAIYGRTDQTECGNSKVTSCKKTVTRIVGTKCNFKQTCLPKASNKIYTDPCFGTYKYLNVTYRCIKGTYFC